MESVGNIKESIKNLFRSPKSPSKHISEIQTPVPGWNYDNYREYVLALTRGRDYLLPIDEYPSRIDLSEPWHKLFNDMRPIQHETWALIGYEEGQRRLVLPTVAEKGLSHSVPERVMFAGLEKARVKAGVTNLVGDIHLHPRDFRNASWDIPSVATSSGSAAFSLGDIYGFLHNLTYQRPADRNRLIMGVVEGNENIFAFATRKSLELVRNHFTGGYGDFAKHWYEKYGWEFQGSDPESQGGGEAARPVKTDAPKLWQVNKAVAYHYQIALYRGFKDKPLLRDYPARINI
jgi:hypothetical protein